jgi:hypothetical protein
LTFVFGALAAALVAAGALAVASSSHLHGSSPGAVGDGGAH